MSSSPDSGGGTRPSGSGPEGLEILFLCHRIPYPPDKGDKIRSYHEISRLGRRHRVTLAALADDPEDLRHVGNLESICREVHVLPLGRRSALARGVIALVCGRPLSRGYFAAPGLRAWLRRKVRERRFDAVFVFSSSVAGLAAEAPGVPKVVDLVDLDSEKWAQYAAHSRPPVAWLYAAEARRMRAWEGQLLRDFDRCIVCTEAEERRLRELHAGGRVTVIRNGVDLARFPYEAPVHRDPVVIFTGAMDYRANVDGVRFFCETAWPAVRSARPDAEFRVVGRNPTAAVRRLVGIPGVRVTGGVPDVGEELRKAAVAVVPLRIAQGVQNKILEAMASGTPVITTAKAQQGIDAVAGRDLLVADGPRDIAAGVVRLLGDEAERVRIAEAGRRRVAEGYDWEGALEALERLVIEAARPSPAS